MLTHETLAAVLLIGAGIIHNYSFMCRKLPAGRIKAGYPTSLSGQTLLNLSWITMAAIGILLCARISPWLCGLALLIYLIALPFLLQPSLARLLGFASLTEYVDTIDKIDDHSE